MSVDAAAPPRLVSEALEASSAWVLERSAQPGEYPRLPGTQTVFDLQASGAFEPYGRYGAKSAMWSVLAQLGGALLLVVALANATWRGLKRLRADR